VQSGTAAPGSIEVRFPDGAEAATFPECETHAAAFRFQPDTSQDWEVSFYRSLNDVDGLLLLGGGRSTLIGPDRGATVMAALGLVAGGISALLFLLSQLAATPDLLDATSPNAADRSRNLTLFGAGIGFVAGFTFESVYRKLAGVDVVRSETVERS
jgi:hypothetical protein